MVKNIYFNIKKWLKIFILSIVLLSLCFSNTTHVNAMMMKQMVLPYKQKVLYDKFITPSYQRKPYDVYRYNVDHSAKINKYQKENELDAQSIEKDLIEALLQSLQETGQLEEFLKYVYQLGLKQTLEKLGELFPQVL